MLDPNNYTAAGTFDGFRFVNNDQSRTLKSGETESKNALKQEEARTKFTDVDWKFPFWGASKRAWYVSFLLLPAISILSYFTTSLSFQLPPSMTPSADTLLQPSALVRLPLTEMHARASASELRLRAREPGREAGLLVDDCHRAQKWSETATQEKGQG